MREIKMSWFTIIFEKGGTAQSPQWVQSPSESQARSWAEKQIFDGDYEKIISIQEGMF